MLYTLYISKIFICVTRTRYKMERLLMIQHDNYYSMVLCSSRTEQSSRVYIILCFGNIWIMRTSSDYFQMVMETQSILIAVYSLAYPLYSYCTFIQNIWYSVVCFVSRRCLPPMICKIIWDVLLVIDYGAC